MASFRGVLLDIDGVLHVSMQAVAGANETLYLVGETGLPGLLCNEYNDQFSCDVGTETEGNWFVYLTNSV